MTLTTIIGYSLYLSMCNKDEGVRTSNGEGFEQVVVISGNLVAPGLGAQPRRLFLAGQVEGDVAQGGQILRSPMSIGALRLRRV